MKMIESLKVVDQVFLRDCEITSEMLQELRINKFVTTTDYFDYLKNDVKIIKINRTKNISSSKIKKELIKFSDL